MRRLVLFCLAVATISVLSQDITIRRAASVDSVTNFNVSNILTNQVNIAPWVLVTYADETNTVIRCTNGVGFRLFLTNNAHLSATNIFTNALWTAIVEVMQDTNGGHVVTFDTGSLMFPDGGTQPSLATNANARHTLYLRNNYEGSKVLVDDRQSFQ